MNSKKKNQENNQINKSVKKNETINKSQNDKIKFKKYTKTKYKK